MAEKIEKPKCDWVEAGNCPHKRKEAVKANPNLRHHYAAATNIWNHLSDEERTEALNNQKSQTA